VIVKKNDGETSSTLKKTDAIVSKYGGGRDSLISMLQDVQAEYRYLPEEAIRHVASRLDLPVIQVFGVATFFKAFSMKPRGKHLVSVCLGTACHVRGAPSVLDEAQRQLGIGPGETSEDMQFTLETVNCLGACALGPIVVIDGEYFGQMTAGKVKGILKKFRKASKGKSGKEREKITVGD
jgi:NADH-quinone oxidoreductase subunit E